MRNKSETVWLEACPPRVLSLANVPVVSMKRRKGENMQDTLAGRRSHRLRPKIIAIVVLLLVQCLSGLYFSLILIADLLAPGRPVIVKGISITTGPAAGVALVVALASPVIAWGLWTLKPWARQRCTLLELMSLAIGAIELLEPGVSSMAPITRLVIAALILVLLYVGSGVRALSHA